MAKLITVLTKKPEEEWLLINKESIDVSKFTQSEIDNILWPYHDYIRALPGVDTTNFKVVTEGDVTTSTMHFDTVENAQNADRKSVV